MSDLFDRIKRLFAPRPRPPAESAGEATADRPPPRGVDRMHVETAPVPTPIREPAVEPTREPADLDELAEVRAALEAVAESPPPAPEPEVVAPSAAATSEPRDSELEDVSETSALADAEEASAEVPEAAEVAAAAPQPVPGRTGEALVLALGSPPLTFTVSKTSATLGRGHENTIRLDDLSVSRRHARIAYRQGGYWLSDLGSMGGTWVNGTRLSAPRRLAFGEVIDIGLLRLTVGFAGGTAAAESKKVASNPRSQMAGEIRRRR